MNGAPGVDIVLSVHNGARYLAEQIESIQGQTHAAWRLWIRDDGSTDGSGEVALAFAARDGRIRVHPGDGVRMGVGQAYGRLLERLPTESRYVFFCDADDVWLPRKVERSLAAMWEAEASAPGPILVHTDLAVVGGDLALLAPSLWAHLGLRTGATTASAIATDNVVTGPTVLINRELLDLVLPVPSEAIHQDWWPALVAASVGRIVSLPESTVLYRRHGANDSGALESPQVRGLAALVRRTAASGSRAPALRAWVDATARQARVAVERYASRMTPVELRALTEIAGIAECNLIERKRRLWRHYALPHRGPARNLGLLLRG